MMAVWTFVAACSQSPQIEQIAVGTVADQDTQVAVPEGYSQHHREENDIQQGGQATALLCAICHFKVRRYFTVLNDTCPRAFMERTDDGDKVCGAADLEQNFPERSSFHRIECLREINKDRAVAPDTSSAAVWQ